GPSLGCCMPPASGCRGPAASSPSSPQDRRPGRSIRRPARPRGASARAAGLIYTQHIVLVHAAIRDSQLDPTPLPSPSACQAAAESTPTCSSLSSPEDRCDQPPPGTRPRVPAAPRRRHLCVAERAPSRSSSEPGSALRSPVTTGPGVAELTELPCYQPASRLDTS